MIWNIVRMELKGWWRSAFSRHSILMVQTTTTAMEVQRSVMMFSSVQLLSHVRLSATPWTAACQASLSITNSESSQTHVHRVRDAIHPSHPLSSPSPPALNLSQHQGLFKWVNSFMRWPKYWRFSFNISPSNEHPGLISFRMDWLDLLAVQGTLKSLLQHHSSKGSILQHSAFFIIQLTSIHDHWKNHSLD